MSRDLLYCCISLRFGIFYFRKPHFDIPDVLLLVPETVGKRRSFALALVRTSS